MLRRLLPIVLVVSACRPSAGEVADLTRRIESLESRIRQLEGGARVPRKVKAKAKILRREPIDQGAVLLAGDAKRVYLVGQKGRIALPGPAPEGEYTLHAAFPGDGGPRDFGVVRIQRDTEVTVTCLQATTSCTLGDPVPE